MYQYIKERFNWLVRIVGLLSFFLIIYQFLFRQGLWRDELSIADNLIRRNFTELLKPLYEYQVVPIMFLWIEKCLLTLTDALNKDWADYFLRLYPLSCGLGIVLLYYKLVFKLTNSKPIALVAYALLVLNPIFIYYTSEIKQYICELFYAILVTYIWLSGDKWNIKRTLLFLGSVLSAILNSFSICFILLALGLYDGWNLGLKYKWNLKSLIRSQEVWFYIVRYLGALIFLISYYFCFLYHHPISKMMLNYWNWRGGFIDLKNGVSVLNSSLEWLYPYFNVLVCFLGMLALLIFKMGRVFTLALVILLTHTLFSYFKLYPLYERLVLYWMLFLPICYASLFWFIYEKCIGRKNLFTPIFCLGIVGVFLFRCYHMPLYIHAGFPYPKQPLAFIEKKYMKNDVIILRRLVSITPYVKKYYAKNFDRRNLINIYRRGWNAFLSKTIKYIASLKDFSRAWIVPNTKEGVVDELQKNDLFKKLNLKVSYCQKLDYQSVCLIEKSNK